MTARGDFKELHCGTCGALIPGRIRANGRRMGHLSRDGLCLPCHRGAGTTRAPYRTADEVLTEWALLRSAGCTMRVAALRMGMTYTALEQAVTRAARRGDPRALRSAS